MKHPSTKEKDFYWQAGTKQGIRILVEAYARLKADPKQWPLTMVGNGPLRKSFMCSLKNRSIQRLHLPGFISESERQRYTREAKWMVTPPHTNEDLGLTPPKHGRSGVPCIATTDGGVEETAGPHALFFCKQETSNRLLIA